MIGQFTSLWAKKMFKNAKMKVAHWLAALIMWAWNCFYLLCSKTLYYIQSVCSLWDLNFCCSEKQVLMYLYLLSVFAHFLQFKRIVFFTKKCIILTKVTTLDSAGGPKTSHVNSMFSRTELFIIEVKLVFLKSENARGWCDGSA